MEAIAIGICSLILTAMSVATSAGWFAGVKKNDIELLELEIKRLNDKVDNLELIIKVLDSDEVTNCGVNVE